MNILMLGSRDETWGIFTQGNIQGIYDCLTEEARKFSEMVSAIGEYPEYFTGSLLEWTIDSTEPLRYCNVTYNYATAEIVQSKWIDW